MIIGAEKMSLLIVSVSSFFYTVNYEAVLILLFVVNDVDPGEQEFSFIRFAFDRL